MARRVVFPASRQACIETFDLPDLQPHEVLVRTHVSLISSGTEGTVFTRNFAPGTHWDQWVKYPFYPGYACVGRIERVGAAVRDWQVGTRVALRSGHASHHVCGVQELHAVPESISNSDAAWFGLGKITFVGAHHAAYALGDEVLILGAGPIGQLSARWATAAGCRKVAVLDPVPLRLDAALLGGATHVLAEPAEKAAAAVRSIFGGKLPMKILDTTGNASVFAQALRIVETHGLLVLLGDSGKPMEQHLTPDLITRHITIRGAHDTFHDPAWPEDRIYGLFFDLLAREKLSLTGLVTHHFLPEECQLAYDTLCTQRDKTMGMQFKWD